MNADLFKKRTKAFALRVIKLMERLPRTAACSVIGRQWLRSGTSAGVNYRAACRTRLRAEFAAKLGTVGEEFDESVYWMELLIQSGAMKPKVLSLLMTEAGEIPARVAQPINTARRGESAIRNPQSAIA